MFGLPDVRVLKSKNMEEHAKTTEKLILINLADKLLETQTELDELAVAARFGKLKAESHLFKC